MGTDDKTKIRCCAGCGVAVVAVVICVVAIYTTQTGQYPLCLKATGDNNVDVNIGGGAVKLADNTSVVTGGTGNIHVR